MDVAFCGSKRHITRLLVCPGRGPSRARCARLLASEPPAATSSLSRVRVRCCLCRPGLLNRPHAIQRIVIHWRGHHLLFNGSSAMSKGCCMDIEACRCHISHSSCCRAHSTAGRNCVKHSQVHVCVRRILLFGVPCLLRRFVLSLQLWTRVCCCHSRRRAGMCATDVQHYLPMDST